MIRILRLSLIILSSAVASSAYAVCDYMVVPNSQTPGVDEKTLSDAASQAAPGDVACLGSYIYRNKLNLHRDGTASEPITFQNAPGARPIFRGVSEDACVGIVADWNILRGIECDGFDEATGAYPESGTDNWPIAKGIVVSGARYNIVEDCYVHHAKDRGILLQLEADYNVIRGNRVERIGYKTTAGTSGDSMEVRRDSSFNLVEGNRVRYGGHHVLDVEESNHNVIRGNLFENPLWVSVALRDLDGVQGNRNVFEGNEIIRSDGQTSSGDPVWLLQFRTWETILRRNVFRDGKGPGLKFSGTNSSPRQDRNSVYSNVMANNGGPGLDLNSWYEPQLAEDNVFANNLVADNEPETQIAIDYYDGIEPPNALQDNVLVGNGIVGPTADVFSVEGVTATTITGLEAAFPTLVGSNRDDPASVLGAERGDYYLAPGSAQRDAGVFLSYTASACSGNTVELEPGGALFFSAGISDSSVSLVPGDGIQFDGDRTVYEVTGVDIATDELTLDSAAPCAAGRGVALAYDGARPDIGMREGFVAQAILPAIDSRYVVDGGVYGGVGIGDGAGDVQLRSILSFDTSTVPGGVALLSAHLDLTHNLLLGSPSKADFGDVLVEMKSGFFGAAPAIQADDFDAVADTRPVFVDRQGESAGDVWHIDVAGLGVGEPADDGLELIDRDGTTEFRLGFEKATDGDGQVDVLFFHSSTASDPADKPTLHISYVAPVEDAIVNEGESGSVSLPSGGFPGDLVIGTLVGTEFVGILSFDTSGVPAGHTVLGAELLIERLPDYEDPYTGAGDLFLDVKAGPFNGDPALEAADVTAPADDSFLLIRQGETPGDVWGALLDPQSISATDVTQVRIRFDQVPTQNGGVVFERASAKLRVYHQP